MIKILKPGIERIKEKAIYRTYCNYCSCEFEFEEEDIIKKERRIDGNIYVKCPCCGKELTRNVTNLLIRYEPLEE